MQERLIFGRTDDSGEIKDRELIETWLTSKRGQKVTVSSEKGTKENWSNWPLTMRSLF